MKFKLIRNDFGLTYTSGILMVDNSYLCDTLEPVDRKLSTMMDNATVRRFKVPGVTAIPYGTYELSLRLSAKFSSRQFYKQFNNGLMVAVMYVPAFEGILFHCGNDAVRDSRGCILVGTLASPGILIKSRLAYKKLMSIINCGTFKGSTLTVCY